ncbi:uncharacterized protein EDB93DRAFT_1102565 [Suillus bovinus]|uniref:uncharacterized protein n=1 Tax=Suillus bovinus TaxID=48563 RepID=UPI001B8727BF|nr:uncharacterized protein EDB93DRAFT_1102565 [Suillus bovinus]KAG2153761.1 hypothetical protein EDB93DRAFT_1102565 [Suillus bovinus]
MSQQQQSFPPGAGPNDTPQDQYPSGHAYRRSQSNSPFRHTTHPSPYPQPNIPPIQGQPELKQESYYTPTSAELYTHAQVLASGAGEGSASAHYTSQTAITRLPPILQVEKKQVTTSATQAASASRRRNEAHFACPVPGCGSTFTRRFNLRGHLRSHTEERPYVCEYPDCKKGFARQHDCKRHQALHATRSQSNICQGCKKTFSRLDALNVTSLYRYQPTSTNIHPSFASIQRHLRSEGGSECRQIVEAQQQAAAHAQAITQSQGPPLPDHPPGNQPGPSSSTAS